MDVDLADAERELRPRRLSPNVYAVETQLDRVTPSLVNDYFYCPVLLWVERRLGAKLVTRPGLVSMLVGRILHERYERYLAKHGNVEVEVRFEVDGFVGVVDAVIYRRGEQVPVEVKTGSRREAHEAQLQMYMGLTNSARGYLVYRDRVETVRRRDVSRLVEEIGRVLKSDDPPPIDRARCSTCIFKRVCWRVLRL